MITPRTLASVALFAALAPAVALGTVGVVFASWCADVARGRLSAVNGVTTAGCPCQRCGRAR